MEIKLSQPNALQGRSSHIAFFPTGEQVCSEGKEKPPVSCTPSAAQLCSAVPSRSGFRGSGTLGWSIEGL